MRMLRAVFSGLPVEYWVLVILAATTFSQGGEVGAYLTGMIVIGYIDALVKERRGNRSSRPPEGPAVPPCAQFTSGESDAEPDQ